MSNESADRQRQRVSRFLQLFPLTLEIAGLSRADLGKHLNEGQMEVRSNTLKAAFKFALQLDAEFSKLKLMGLLPVAVEIAGLHRAESGKHFNEGQMEVRAATLRNAFRAAHQLAIAIARSDEPPEGGAG